MNRTVAALLCAAFAAFLATVAPALGAATPPPNVYPTPAPSVAPHPTHMPTPVPVPATVQPSPAPTTLTLNQAEEIALASSPTLAFARAVVDQQQAGVGIALSGELPSISATGATTRSQSIQRITVPNGHGGFTQTTQPFLVTSNDGAISLKQLILDGGRVSAEVQSARYSTNSAKLTLLRDIQTVLLTVAQQYFAALQARHQLGAAEQSLSVAKVQEQLVEAQYRAGVASHADVLTAQLPVAQAELTVAQAQNGEATNIASLLATMGLPANTPVSLQDDTSISAVSPDVNELIASALLERTDLAAAKESVNSTEANVRAARLQHVPNISGTATSGTSSTAIGGGSFAANWSVGASLTFPLYEGGLIGSDIRQAQAVDDQAKANYATARLNVYLSVQQAYLTLVTAAASLKASQVALDDAGVVLNVTNAQYKAGVTTLPLLLNAQSQLTTARSNYVTALYSYKVAQQNLLYAEGTLSPS